MCSLFVFVIFELLFVGTNGQVINESLSYTISSFDAFPRLWISDLFYEALANFTVRNVGSSACQNQAKIYENNFRNYTTWAVRMAESWDRRPIGILTGNRYHMGIYDECVNIHQPIRGQYCLTEVKLSTQTNNDYSFNRTENLHDFGNNHGWHTVLGWKDYPDQIQRNILNIGICIPDSCSAMDLQISLQNELDKVFLPEQIKTIVKVDPILCTVSGNTYPFTTGFFITSLVFSLVVLICCCATVHHYIILAYQDRKKETVEISNSIFNTFSLIKSFRELIKYNPDNDLNVFNGSKVIHMVLVLFGHRFMYFVGFPINHTIALEDLYINGPDIFLTCMNLVDPFFFTSGYLIYVTVSPIFLKKGPTLLKFLMPLLYRIIRMLPAYIAMIAFTANILPHLGHGPLWPQKIWPEAEICSKYWWMNLLFINNYMDVKYQCLLISWYISCDLQLFIVGIIILYIYLKNKNWGTTLLCAFTIASLCVPFIVTFMTKSEGLLKLYLPFLENPRSDKTFNLMYRPSYMRAIPFFIGIVMSIVIEKLKKNKTKFSQTTVYGGTFIVVVICVYVQLFGALFYDRQKPYNALEHSFYATVSHCTWTLLNAWIVLIHFTTGYGPLLKLLDNRITAPLGRLSYSVFLVNLIVMLVSQSYQRSPSDVSLKTLMDTFVYDLLKTYFMGLLLHLVIEAPFANLIRMLFGRGPVDKSSNSKETPIEKSISVETSKNESSNL